MKFGRSRKFYILCSFGFVLTLFFFAHWKTFRTLELDQNVIDRNFLHDQKINLRNSKSGRGGDTEDAKCSLEIGVQTSGHCMNKGKYTLYSKRTLINNNY